MFCKTKGNVNPQGKPRVYFTCHPDDFELCFKKVSDDIFKTHDCAIYYTEDMTEEIAEQDKETDLSRNNLFVIPVTQKLLNTQNRTMNKDYPFAIENHIPVLPIMMETGIDDIYSQPDKFGELQYLYPYSSDLTEISYEEKLKKYLESVLISDEMAKRVRAAFDAYIFLSYRKKDRRYANELMRLIHNNPECRDIAIWFDEFLTPGESFKKNIEKILDDCNLFALLVTPQLLEKVIDENGIERDNYVLGVELPEARKRKEAKGTEIFAVEMEETDAKTLRDFGIDNYVNAKNSDDFRYRLLESISKIAITTNNTPEHNFLIGLAYLDGIDVEVDRKRAVELIADAAEQELPEALIKLIVMYTDGIGVIKDQSEVLKWSQKLSDYYFKKIFTKKGEIKSKDKLNELFKHYKDKYWNEVISCFLVKVDEVIPFTTTKKLYDILLTSGICEYTLLFDICKKMNCHQEETQILLTNDILRKSASGIYPPYGPLFWYVPEYELYEALILALETMKHKDFFTKALALTRDVCWIFGHYNTVDEITNHVNGKTLFNQASLTGVRYGLCELFYTGKTDSIEGSDVYPRCFNIKEAKNWKEDGCGVLGRMLNAFEDELGLYNHEMYNELDGEWVGIVATEYNTEHIETVLPQKSCKKLCGLFLSPSTETKMKKSAINTRRVCSVYIAETLESIENECFADMSLRVNITILNNKLIYFRNKVKLPNCITKIDCGAFYNSKSLVSVILPDTVTEIGKGAFKGCKCISSIILPNGLIKICSEAFCGCNSLHLVILSDSISEIDDNAFKNCSSLTSISLPNGLTKINRNAFAGCRSLVSVMIPDSVEIIEESAFENCISLISITCPKNLSIIEAWAFYGCNSLENIFFFDYPAEIGIGVFEGCVSLSSIVLPNGLTEVDRRTFSGCSSLATVSLPNSIQTIRDDAFRGCKSLTTITFPESLTTVEKNVFVDCDRLESIYNCPIEYTRNSLGVSENCIINYRDEKTSKTTFVDLENITEIKGMQFAWREDIVKIQIPQSITKIGPYAFQECTALKSIQLSDSITEIGDCAFINCNSLISITLPAHITQINKSLFSGCDSLISITLPNSVTQIGITAFYGCRSLITINIPSGLTEINIGLFEKCISLSKVTIPDSVEKIRSNAFFGCCSISTLLIPNNVGLIETAAFMNCNSLTSIKIPNKVKVIEDSVFSGCSSLKTIQFSDHLSKIGSFAFKDCCSLVATIFPEGLEEIGSCAFLNCYSLTTIKLPDSINEIGNSAFKNCQSLYMVSLPDNISIINEELFQNCISLHSITIPGNIKKIEDRAFSGCHSLSSIIIPESVEEIGASVFKDCRSLCSILIPDSISRISYRMFEDCDSLVSIMLPNSIYEIEAYSFSKCVLLKSIVFPNKITEINRGVLQGCIALQSVVLPEVVVSIENEAFFCCTSLASIELPSGIKRIGKQAFFCCVSLHSVVIPQSVKYIGDDAFGMCVGLAEIMISRRFEDDLPRIFSGIDLSNVKIYWI